MVPCAGASGGPRCGRLELRGDRGEAGGSSRGTDRRPTRRPQERGWEPQFCWSAGPRRRRAERRVPGVAAWGRRARRPSHRLRAPRWRPASSAAAGSPRPLPCSLPLRHFLGPGPDQLPWYFQNCRAARPLCAAVGPCVRSPTLAQDLGGVRRDRASTAVVCLWGPPGGAEWGWGVAGVLPWAFFSPIRGRGTGSKKDP